jgi:hypothetical protein
MLICQFMPLDLPESVEAPLSSASVCAVAVASALVPEHSEPALLR